MIGLGAAIENVIPPIPADTFVLFGAFLAAAGRANPWTVFFVTWLANVGSAVGVYGLARRHGDRFFRSRAGHWLLHPRQLEQIGRFYARWGVPAIFVSRFLPALRAMVPVFGGVAHVPLARVLPPLAIASGLWYGFLVWLGAAAGRNWEEILATVERYGRIGAWIAAPLLLLIVLWWWRSRREPRQP